MPRIFSDEKPRCPCGTTGFHLHRWRCPSQPWGAELWDIEHIGVAPPHHEYGSGECPICKIPLEWKPITE